MDLVRASFPRLAALRTHLVGPSTPDAGVEPDTYGSLIERHQVTHFQCTPSEANIVLADQGSRASLSAAVAHACGWRGVPRRRWPPISSTSLVDRWSTCMAPPRQPFGRRLTGSPGPMSRQARSPLVSRCRTPSSRLSTTLCHRGRSATPVSCCWVGAASPRAITASPSGQDERFVTIDGHLMYRTGDVASRQSGQPLGFHGRIDSQVKISRSPGRARRDRDRARGVNQASSKRLLPLTRRSTTLRSRGTSCRSRRQAERPRCWLRSPSSCRHIWSRPRFGDGTRSQ